MAELIKEVIETLTRATTAQASVNESVLAICKEITEQLTDLRTRVRELEEHELRRMKTGNRTH